MTNKEAEKFLNSEEATKLIDVINGLDEYLVIGLPNDIFDMNDYLSLTLLKTIPTGVSGKKIKAGSYLIKNDNLKIYTLEAESENPSSINVAKGIPLLIEGVEIGLGNIFYYIYEYMDIKADVRALFDDYLTPLLKEPNKKNELSEVMPSSPALFLTNQFINSVSAGRLLKSNKNTKLEYSNLENDTLSIRSVNKNNVIIVSHDAISLMQGKNNKGLSKIFAFVMQQANAQNYQEEIGFPLQALVDAGIYSSVKSARTGFKNNIKKIMGFTVEGEVKKGQKVIKEEGGKIIFHYKIENNYITLNLNPKLNIEFIAEFFTLLPSFSYALGTNAFSLAQYIFYIARQHTRDIKERGYFNISLEAVRAYLCLPTPDQTQNHTILIKEPIEKAIEEIEIANNSRDFTITPVYNENSTNIREWLDGYLEIGLSGDYAKSFIDIATKTERSIESRKKSQDKAKQRAYEKKLLSKK